MLCLLSWQTRFPELSCYSPIIWHVLRINWNKLIMKQGNPFCNLLCRMMQKLFFHKVQHWKESRRKFMRVYTSLRLDTLNVGWGVGWYDDGHQKLPLFNRGSLRGGTQVCVILQGKKCINARILCLRILLICIILLLNIRRRNRIEPMNQNIFVAINVVIFLLLKFVSQA